MMKVFAFRVSLMNGTVTMDTHVEACASRELAEQVKEAVRRANEHNDTLGGMRLYISDIDELTLWESADEVPVLNKQPARPKTREELEREREQCLHDLKHVRECLSVLKRKTSHYDWLNKMALRQEQRLKEIESELDGKEGESV